MPPASTKKSKMGHGQQKRTATATSSVPTVSADTLRKLQKVTVLQQEGRLAEAFELCREINKADPSCADAFNLGGVIAFQGGNAEVALKLLRKAVATDPNHAGAHNNLGIVLKESEAHEAAIESFRKALKLNPEDADAHFNLGNTYSLLERHEDAKAAYERAVAARPGFTDALQNLGITLTNLGKHEAAAKAFESVIKSKPDFGEAHGRLAGAYENLGRYKDALEAGKRSFELAPDDVETVYSYANLLANHKKYDDAISTYEHALELKPDFTDACYKLGRAHYKKGDFQGAIKRFEKVLEVDPKFVRAQFNLLVTTLNGFGPEAMLKSCDERLEIDPRDRYALAAKAAGLHLVGKREEASALLGINRFIRQFRVESPMGYDDLDAFNAALADEVCNHPSLEYEKSGHATRNGGHTATINKNAAFPIAVLEQFITDSAKEYIRDLGNDPTHPFPADVPKSWRVVMWAVVMNTQGFQLPHIHPAAWLSGVYYPLLPDVIDDADETKGGWIEFGRARDMLFDEDDPELALFKPEEGLMFLFPGYMYHRTIPFDSDQKRVSIAFDIIPNE